MRIRREEEAWKLKQWKKMRACFHVWTCDIIILCLCDVKRIMSFSLLPLSGPVWPLTSLVFRLELRPARSSVTCDLPLTLNTVSIFFTVFCSVKSSWSRNVFYCRVQIRMFLISWTGDFSVYLRTQRLIHAFRTSRSDSFLVSQRIKQIKNNYFKVLLLTETRRRADS